MQNKNQERLSQDRGERVLTLSCEDRPGIVAAVAGCIAEESGNIVESHQYGQPEAGRFFMRVAFEVPPGQSCDDFATAFAPVATRFAMDWRVHGQHQPLRVMILVSKQDHCLMDLLYRRRIGALRMDLVGVVSNHSEAEGHVAAAGVPFHHLPVTRETKLEQEAALWSRIKDAEAELVILARYMQILSDGLVAKLAGRCINIHHGFLPSFKGAQPYKQAHERGVKLIGATAHYVTADLDEGPIIEQETRRVHHAMTVADLIAAGRELETSVLARAVALFLDHRVLLNGHRTVVF